MPGTVIWAVRSYLTGVFCFSPRASGLHTCWSTTLFSLARRAINTGVSDPAIIIDALEKSFPPALGGWRSFTQPFAAATVPALRGISLRIKPGEAVALLGTNGAGKTTLLRILATLLLPTRGKLRMAGIDPVSDPAAVRSTLGYHAGSDLGFYPRLTGRENLRFFGRLNHLPDSRLQIRIAEAAEQFGLTDALDRQVRTLSSGTIQRLSLLRALLHEPRILLLDEPTRSLDALAAADFRHFIKSEVLRRRGTTLLFASHTLSEIELLADRVVLLDKGLLVAFDTSAALQARCGATSLEDAFCRLTGHRSLSLAEPAS